MSVSFLRIMKYGILCLFAFCSFKGVFADSADDSADNKVLSNYLADNRMDNVWNQLNSDMEAAAYAANIPKMKSTEVLFKCWTSHNYPVFSETINMKGKACYHCYGKYKENIKLAKNCCNKIVNGVKREAKKYLALANTCMAKCAQSANNCLKEIVKERRSISEKQPKGINTGEGDKTKNLDSEESKKTNHV